MKERRSVCQSKLRSHIFLPRKRRILIFLHITLCAAQRTQAANRKVLLTEERFQERHPKAIPIVLTETIEKLLLIRITQKSVFNSNKHDNPLS